jgi:predicted nucleotidyltransferase
MEQVTSIIKNTVREIFPDAQVMLFGSRARGDFRPDSDYDILVITSKELIPENKMSYRTNIRKNLLSHKIFSDILIQSRSEISVKRKLTGHIIKKILDECIEL